MTLPAFILMFDFCNKVYRLVAKAEEEAAEEEEEGEPGQEQVDMFSFCT